MRTFQKFSLPIVLFTIITLFYGCGSSGVATVAFKEQELRKPSDATQTKGDITITLTPLNQSSMYNEPDLFSFSDNNITGNFSDLSVNSYYPKDFLGKHWFYTLGMAKSLVAYKVKITNGTTHILRMKNARVYLITEGQDPIAAFNVLGNPTLVPTTIGKEQMLFPKSYVIGDNSFVDWLTKEEYNYELNRSHGLLDISYPIGLGSQVIAQNIRNYKLVTDVSREILPNTTFNGILIFPIYSSAINNAKIMFYDITIKTDAAGNPTKKVSFEYPIKSVDQQMWFDSKKEKRWKVGVPPTPNK